MNSQPFKEGLRSYLASWQKSLLVLLLCNSWEVVHSQTVSFRYVVTNETVTITGYQGTDTDVVIPSTIEGRPVTRVAERALYETASMVRLTVPDTVAMIEEEAFSRCLSLTEVALGTGLAVIGDSAFMSCSNLANVTLSTGLRNIGEGAFALTYKPKTVTIPATVTNIGPAAFWNSGLTMVTIEEGAVWTGDSAFAGSSLRSVVLPQSMKTIPNGTFSACFALRSVTIPEGIANIGNSAFELCNDLETVIIPASISAVGAQAFGKCSSLRSVYFLGNAPTTSNPFPNAAPVVYYRPWTSGWGATWGGATTHPWLPYPVIDTSTFSVDADVVGFLVNWADRAPVVIETTTDLQNATWSIVSTNTPQAGYFYFRDPYGASYPRRFYRVRPL